MADQVHLAKACWAPASSWAMLVKVHLRRTGRPTVATVT